MRKRHILILCLAGLTLVGCSQFVRLYNSEDIVAPYELGKRYFEDAKYALAVEQFQLVVSAEPASDPSMNWRVPELDGLSIVSFSDAHSPSRMGRELTVFEGEPSYDGLRAALAAGSIASTVEFHPEEGKYHYDGHRKCAVCQHPATTMETGERCPVCGRKMTLGVLHRIEALSARPAAVERGADGVLSDPSGVRPPFRRLVGLETVIAEAVGHGRNTEGVQQIFRRLVESVGNERHVLTEAPNEAIASVAGEHVADGVMRSRAGDVAISPGYDGVYGTVRLWGAQRI